jgi:hypothetical protein
MPDSGLRIVASVIISLGFAHQASGQAAKQEPAARKGDRPAALFAGGAMVGKTLYISGKGDYRPNAEFPEKVRNCLGEIHKNLESAGLDLRSRSGRPCGTWRRRSRRPGSTSATSS